MAFNNPSIFSFSAYGQPSLDSMTRRTQPELYNIAKAREVIEKIQQAARESENWYPWFRYFHFMKSRIYVFQKSKADNNPIKNFFNLIILFLQIIKQFILIFLLENKKFKKLKSSINAIILSTNLK